MHGIPMQPQILLETLRGNKQGAEQLVRRFEEGRYQEEETKKRKRTETVATSMKKNRQRPGQKPAQLKRLDSAPG